MVRYSKNKDMHRTVSNLVKQGWTYVENGHGKLTHPSGRRITFSTSPSDKNAYKQLERDVRKFLERLEKENEPTKEN